MLVFSPKYKQGLKTNKINEKRHWHPWTAVGKRRWHPGSSCGEEALAPMKLR